MANVRMPDREGNHKILLHVLTGRKSPMSVSQHVSEKTLLYIVDQLEALLPADNTSITGLLPIW